MKYLTFFGLGLPVFIIVIPYLINIVTQFPGQYTHEKGGIILVTGASSGIGKNIGDDFKEGKITLPVLLALKKANSSEKAFWKRVIEDLDQEKNDFKKAQSLLTKHSCIGDLFDINSENKCLNGSAKMGFDINLTQKRLKKERTMIRKAFCLEKFDIDMVKILFVLKAHYQLTRSLI